MSNNNGDARWNVLTVMDGDRVDAHLHRATNWREWSGSNRSKAFLASVEARHFVASLIDAMTLLSEGKYCDDSGREWDGFDKDDVIAFAKSVLAARIPPEQAA